MESKWRLNRYLTGWNDGPFALIARLVSGPDAGFYLAEVVESGRRLGYFGYPDVSGFVADWVQVLNFPLSYHFPWGYPVEPD